MWRIGRFWNYIRSGKVKHIETFVLKAHKHSLSHISLFVVEFVFEQLQCVAFPEKFYWSGAIELYSTIAECNLFLRGCGTCACNQEIGHTKYYCRAIEHHQIYCRQHMYGIPHALLWKGQVSFSKKNLLGLWHVIYSHKRGICDKYNSSLFV